MSDNRIPEDADWSKVEARMNANEASAKKGHMVERPIVSLDSDASMPSQTGLVPVPLPDTAAPRGILMQFKKNQIDRQTALKAIQAEYDARLDALRYQLVKAVNVSKARADLIAEEFLAKLNSDHVRMMDEMGVQNIEGRANALIKARQTIAAKIYEVQQKNWPEPLIDRCLADILELEKRACAEMMKELGT